jgi:5-methylcytosine-specific restriction endonuclease McrA
MAKDKSSTIIKDPKTQSAVIGNLKRCFSRSPDVQAFLRANRIERPWHKKDGTLAKKPRVYYICMECNKEFGSTKIQVDHKIPVIPSNIPSKHMSFDVIVDRLFCDTSNLQILCKEDHKKKSLQENAERREWISKLKYIVYETTNKVNNKKYIGVHKCVDYDDGYLGSGTAFKHALKKYGRANFYRTIVDVFDNADEALYLERKLVTEEIVKSGAYYNLVVGGAGSMKKPANLGKKIICHQTGEVFASVTEAAESIGISSSSISKALDNPSYPVKNLHFFSKEGYNPEIKVVYPRVGRQLIHMNSGAKYRSIKEASEHLSINYKSLRNALVEETDDGLYRLENQYFIYNTDFDPDQSYAVTEKKIRCVELDMTFDTCVAAATFIKHKNPAHGGIAIGRAARTNKKMYKYTWEYIYETIILYQP